MLDEVQVQERNARLMNTVPDTRVLLSIKMGTSDFWIGTNTLYRYGGYIPMYGTFGFKQPKGEDIEFVMGEDSPNWDFEVYDK